ncbi:MAG: hypothetical protein E7052_08820 [Lentisphaerae bacterium]|nr:hypothetical protein [Lentisphaerota bacterium]
MHKFFVLLLLLSAGTMCFAQKIVIPKQLCSGQAGSVLAADVPFMSNFTLNGAPEKKPQAATHVKMFHDGKYLYVGIKAEEPYMDKIKASWESAAYSIWNNDSVEFNFDPDGRNRILGKIIVDTLGNVADFYGLDDNTGNDRFVLERCRKSYTKLISLVKKSDHWSVELAIPLGIFYYGEKKDKLSPRINIARTRYAVREGSDLFPLESNTHNFPRKFPEFEFKDLQTSEYGYAVEGLSIKNRKTADGFAAQVSAKVINPAKRFRNLKAVVRLLDKKGNEIATQSKIFAALPGKLANVTVTLKPQTLGKCKVEFALQELSGVLLSNQLMDTVLSYSPITVKVLEPAYRNNIYASMPELKKIRAQIDLSEVDGKPLTATLSGPGYRKSVTIQQPQAVNTVEFPFEKTGLGSYTLEVGSSKTVIRKLPHQPHEVYLDKKGVIYVDGRKFLPFGQSYAGDDWKTRGVTITETPARWDSIPKALSYLDRMHKHGVKVKLYPYYRPVPGEDPFDNASRSRGKLSDRQKELLKEFVGAVGKHPAVLAWYNADEPEGHGHNEDWYADMLKFMQEIDPYHPTVICNYGVAGQKRFYVGCDILFPDTYPNYFQDGTTELGRRSTYEHITHATALRPAWQCLHGFDWGKINSRDSHSRAPDYDELRQQLYSSFLGNAKGVTFYAATTWGYFSNQLRYGKDYLGPEVDSLKDLLLEDTEQLVKFSGADRRNFLCGMKRYRGEFIIIAVNLSDRPCTVEFSSVQALPEKLAVVGENRSVSTGKNRFRDSFKPHETHVYASGKVENNAVDHAKVRQIIQQADLDRKRPGNLAAVERELSLSEINEYGKGKIPAAGPVIRCSSEIALHLPKQNTCYFLHDGVRMSRTQEMMTWTPQFSDKAPWVEIDFGKEVTAGRCVIYSGGNEKYFSVLRKGAVQVLDKQGKFQTVATFDNNQNYELQVKFAPVKTRKLRLELHDFARRHRLLHELEVYEK